MMSDIPAIVKELRDQEKNGTQTTERESRPVYIKEKNEKDQNTYSTEDALDALWFDMWKFL